MAQNNIESYVTVEARSETWINDQTNENQNLMKYRSTLFLHTHTVLGKSHPLRFPRLLILFAQMLIKKHRFRKFDIMQQMPNGNRNPLRMIFRDYIFHRLYSDQLFLFFLFCTIFFTISTHATYDSKVFSTLQLWAKIWLLMNWIELNWMTNIDKFCFNNIKSPQLSVLLIKKTKQTKKTTKT